MINRRNFIAAAAGGVFASSCAIAQQPAKAWRIGILSATSRQSLVDSGYLPAFMEGMRALGHIEGKTFTIEWRDADGQYERLPALAAEIVRLKVDLVVAYPSAAIRAAQKATTTIPVVFPSTGDPVGSGFVASLARPGSNLTGLSNIDPDISAKNLEMLVAAAPGLSRVAVVVNPGSSSATAISANVRDAGRKLGMTIMTVEARTPEEITAGFAAMKRDNVMGFVIGGDALFTAQRRQIADLAIKQGLPSVSQQRPYAVAGGLMTYGHDTTDNFRRMATYVDKILKGAKPGDLPVEQPTGLNLVINMKTAKALRLAIPQSLLLRAAEVLE
jgi:putative ABC transport system substrate-binding protein